MNSDEINDKEREGISLKTFTAKCSDCEPIRIVNKASSSGSSDEDDGNYCGTCKIFVDTMSKLRSHSESKSHKEEFSILEGNTELEYDKYDSKSSHSEDGFKKELTDEELEQKYFREYFCKTQGFGFDCSKCCKRKNRTIDRTVSNTSFEDLKILIDEAAKVNLESLAEEEKVSDSWDCLSDSSVVKSIRQKILGPFDRFGESCGTRTAGDTSGSEETDEECLWNRLREKPSSKDCSRLNSGKNISIKYLNPVDKLIMVPREEDETILELNDGFFVFEKVNGNYITLRVVLVESLQKSQDNETCCQ